MHKRIINLLDSCLPVQLTETEEVSDVLKLSLLYRARIIVACNMAGLLITFLILMTYISLKATLFIQICLLFMNFSMAGSLIYIKNLKKNFERNLKAGAFVQICFLTSMIYISAFAESGMGFFGLIWLIPFYLMIAFLFKSRTSLIFASAYSLLFFVVSSFYFHQLQTPLLNIPHFSLIFFIFLAIAGILVYIVSFTFVNLNSELQKAVITQRELLLESAKYQSLGQMASNLAHDINNPLFAIQGKLHQMRNLLSREQLDQKNCDQIVESVEATILKLSQIVKGITTFAREGRGDQMVSIRVDELVEGNLALALNRIKILRIDLEVRITPNIQVICYPSFVSQILLNLINNAIDALEGRELKKIIVEAHIENEWVHIIVKDSGSGVPVEIENKIFDSFFTTKAFGKGTGIGLSIAKGLAEAHSGDLKYQRSSNLTNFILRLPSYE